MTTHNIGGFIAATEISNNGSKVAVLMGSGAVTVYKIDVTETGDGTGDATIFDTILGTFTNPDNFIGLGITAGVAFLLSALIFRRKK